METTYVYDDGGRSLSGFKGSASDCVTRSIAIATGKAYKEVYDDLNVLAKNEKKKRISSSRNGVHRVTYQKYLESLGWEWVSTMKVGSGCTTHLTREELPSGRIIARLSKHLVAVVDGVIHDTFDSARDGRRCVYGYFHKP